MKSILHPCLFWILGLLVGLPVFAQQDRRAVWVHGLNESGNGQNPDFWGNYANLFALERRIWQVNGGSTNRTYFTRDGVTNFRTGVVTNNVADNTSLAIGHSMGSLAIRDAALQNPNQFGAMIYCGSPLNGAPIAANSLNGNVVNVADQWASDLGLGPLTSIGGFVGLGGGIISSAIFAAGNFSVAGHFVSEVARGPLQEELNPDNYGRPTLQDLSPNSQYLSAIRIQSIPVPSVSIYGSEASPIHFRLASSQRSYDRNELNSDDQYWVEKANNTKDTYYAFYVSYLGGAIISGIFGFVNPMNWWFTGNFSLSAYAWRQGYDCLNSRSETDYASLIGANLTTEVRTYTYITNQCSPQQYYGECGAYADPVQRQQCYDACWRPFTEQYTFPVQAGSDAFIPAYSQRGDNTQAGPGGGNLYEALEVNHMEMRNHPQMRAQFNLIFNRNDNFQTDIR